MIDELLGRRFGEAAFSRHAPSRRARSLTLALLVAAACAEGRSEPGASNTERYMVGDTLVVRSTGPGAWGDTVRLVEEVRVGVAEGPDEYLFGRIDELAVGPAGSLLIFDGSVPVLRRYDSTGHYLGSIGRAGSGPGEYRDGAGLSVAADGTILQYDPGNGRVNRYDSGGNPLGAWTVGASYYTGQSFVPDSSGGAYVKILLADPRPDEEWINGYLHYAPDGTVRDTVEGPARTPQSTAGRTNLHPRYFWTVSPLGAVVAGSNETYAFEMHAANGITRIERAVEPVPYRDEEHAQLLAALNHRNEGPAVALPGNKPAFQLVVPMPDGRLWVRASVASLPLDSSQANRDRRNPDRPVVTWRMPSAYDVFASDGSYLGRVHLPNWGMVGHAEGERLWAVERGEDDVQSVVRYRLLLEPGRSAR